MKQSVKRAWVKALRSGDYTKGFYQLKDLNGHYDALGVLTQLAVDAGAIPVVECYDDPDSIFKGYRFGDKGDMHAVGMSKALIEWSGLEYGIGYKIGLMGDMGKSFKKIATYIEETL